MRRREGGEGRRREEKGGEGRRREERRREGIVLECASMNFYEFFIV